MARRVGPRPACGVPLHLPRVDAPETKTRHSLCCSISGVGPQHDLLGTKLHLEALLWGATQSPGAPMLTLNGHRVLVVEDELLVGLDIADAFKGAGAEVIIARTLRDAMHQAETLDLTAAVIDHVLQDGKRTSDVCAKLKERDIPFIVYSGFSKLDGACADGELVQKPASPGMLLAAMQDALAERGMGLA